MDFCRRRSRRRLLPLTHQYVIRPLHPSSVSSQGCQLMSAISRSSRKSICRTSMGSLGYLPERGCTGALMTYGVNGRSRRRDLRRKREIHAILEDVLSEVIDLFPSEYIHVGGDECLKVRWEKCPKCQARIKAEGGIKGDKEVSAEEYLQSYVISRMEKFVESKGRHIIGWDEILEGGLARMPR